MKHTDLSDRFLLEAIWEKLLTLDKEVELIKSKVDVLESLLLTNLINK